VVVLFLLGVQKDETVERRRTRSDVVSEGSQRLGRETRSRTLSSEKPPHDSSSETVSNSLIDPSCCSHLHHELICRLSGSLCDGFVLVMFR